MKNHNKSLGRILREKQIRELIVRDPRTEAEKQESERTNGNEAEEQGSRSINQKRGQRLQNMEAKLRTKPKPKPI
jgi:hypothetical protein